MPFDPKPEKMSITKVDPEPGVDFDHLEVDLNPATMQEVIAAQYARLDVIGQSHKPLQYLGTENAKFRIEIFLRSGGRGQDFVFQLHEQRKFLLSLMYPRRARPGALIKTVSPPRVLFFWPEVVSLTAHVTRVSINHELFRPQGASRQMRATLEIEEVRDFRLLSEDVARDGTLRVP